MNLKHSKRILQQAIHLYKDHKTLQTGKKSISSFAGMRKMFKCCLEQQY